MTTLGEQTAIILSAFTLPSEQIDTLSGGRHWCGAPTVTTYSVASVTGTLIAYTRTWCPRHGQIDTGNIPDSPKEQS